MRHTSYVAAACLLAALGCTEGPVVRTELDRTNERVVRSPSAMPDQAWSSIYRDFTVPGGLSGLTVEYDYEVDSQAGADWLLTEYSTDGGSSYTIAGQASGRAAGHARHDLPTGFPIVRVRFRYAKDAAQSAGQDMAWLDNVTVRGDGAPIESATHHFQRDWPGAVPEGWTAVGAGGSTGMRTSWLPEARSVGFDDDQGPETLTFLERTVQFPSANQNVCSFDYFIDTAPSHRLRVYSDAQLLFDSGGPDQGDSATLEMGASPGPKVLRFEFARDGAPSAGGDVVRVDHVECFSDNVMLERHSFDGEDLLSTPEGWSTGCSGACANVSGWQVRRRTPHLSYLPERTVPAPTLDGIRNSSEYPGRTEVPLPNVSVPEAEPSRASLLLVDGAPATLFVHATIQAESVGTLGDETGRMTIYLDQARPATLSRVGECPDWTLPGPLDYRVGFDYALAAGVAEQTISTFDQDKGHCASGAWVPLGDTAPLAIGAVVLDSGEERVGIELSVALPPVALADRLVGLALRRVAPDLMTVREHFPYLEDRSWRLPSVPPDTHDSYRWETVKLDELPAVHGPIKNEAWDDCCYPRGKRWRF